ncbi:MDIS1-interacting receptor like kinase 2-like [Dioscorea cayenensis subsp. rotundata]|uniref:MDIS1-interacting receptor like kinase 2-like n=1 Tax=Dioscorea cayennensis subsp. rotundata TaxID=55577 RepID=A0AB40AYT4_DIOCR|nr:MDIS1-interacting receptor like kinase 2-like [Dioscorea cayenensis subsp. rotundata]
MESWLPSKFTTIRPAEILMIVLLSQLVILFSNLCFPVPITVTASRIESQGRALLQWKASLETQDLLHTWMSTVSPCNWTGITCRYDGHLMLTITKVQLRELGLEGKLETLNFSSLPSLRVLDLNGNHIYGSILEAISGLSKLINLDLSVNKLRGIIPSELGNLTRLKTLWLSQNQISGSIPPSFGKLMNMNLLAISKNFLVGSIPPVFRNLTKLKGLYLWSNKLSGSIPSEIGNLVSLIGLDISNNQITKLIPPLGSLKSLTGLALSHNYLFGKVPDEFTNLTNLNNLQLVNDNLSGNLPQDLPEEVYLTNLLWHIIISKVPFPRV